jgi:hypothetical protein
MLWLLGQALRPRPLRSMSCTIPRIGPARPRRVDSLLHDSLLREITSCRHCTSKYNGCAKALRLNWKYLHIVWALEKMRSRWDWRDTNNHRYPLSALNASFCKDAKPLDSIWLGRQFISTLRARYSVCGPIRERSSMGRVSPYYQGAKCVTIVGILQSEEAFLQA